MQILADNLRHARERLGLSQLQVEVKTEIGHKSISNYENNVSSPDPDNLVKLCDLYNMSADALLGRRTIPMQATLSQDERYLIEVFRSLTPEGQAHMMQTAKAAAIAFPNRSQD